MSLLSISRAIKHSADSAERKHAVRMTELETKLLVTRLLGAENFTEERNVARLNHALWVDSLSEPELSIYRQSVKDL